MKRTRIRKSTKQITFSTEFCERKNPRFYDKVDVHVGEGRKKKVKSASHYDELWDKFKATLN